MKGLIIDWAGHFPHQDDPLNVTQIPSDTNLVSFVRDHVEEAEPEEGEALVGVEALAYWLEAARSFPPEEPFYLMHRIDEFGTTYLSHVIVLFPEATSEVPS